MSRVLENKIHEDLFNELRWLLCSATEWDAYEKLVEGPSRTKEPCHHLKVYLMDSAFVHARSLYEFFTNPKPQSERLSWRDYGMRGPLISKRYNRFIRPLHGRVMHLNKNRTGYRQIKGEVLRLALDVLALWQEFSEKSEVQPYRNLLDDRRKRAIKEATSVAEQYRRHGYKSPFGEVPEPDAAT